MGFRSRELRAFIMAAAFILQTGAIKNPVAAGDYLKERLLGEAPRKWQEYQLHSRRFQGSVLDTMVDLRVGGK